MKLFKKIVFWLFMVVQFVMFASLANITLTQTQYLQAKNAEHEQFLSFLFESLQEKDTSFRSTRSGVKNSVFYVSGKQSRGTGFQIMHKNKSYIVTNEHVCKPYVKKGYMFINKIKRKILKTDKDNDLCILEPMTNYPSLLLSHETFKTQEIATLGYPASKSMTMTTGEIVSNNFSTRFPVKDKKCVGKNLKLIKHKHKKGVKHKKHKKIQPQCIRTYSDIIDTNMLVYFGSSGGPLFNKKGQVVGVVFGYTAAYWGVAVKSDKIVKLIERNDKK